MTWMRRRRPRRATGLVVRGQRDVGDERTARQRDADESIAIRIGDDRAAIRRVTSMVPPVIGTPHGGSGSGEDSR
jgi:hypothetical protein